MWAALANAPGLSTRRVAEKSEPAEGEMQDCQSPGDSLVLICQEGVISFSFPLGKNANIKLGLSTETASSCGFYLRER